MVKYDQTIRPDVCVCVCVCVCVYVCVCDLGVFDHIVGLALKGLSFT